MRIATQTESALICRVFVPIHCLSNSGVPGTTENAFFDGQALKVHTVQDVVQTDHHRAVFWPRDEAHFWLNGYVNKQNCRIWSEANPQLYVETPLDPEKLTVWCALWAGGIIGPYFFKNDEGHNVTVNGDRYRAMITNFFIPELSNHDVQEL
ncbi:DUF4817 domain-containing protein [Trichonephila clavipes]|nr:DUF4817 domain-containing protein [Trichonephila clavipes]